MKTTGITADSASTSGSRTVWSRLRRVRTAMSLLARPNQGRRRVGHAVALIRLLPGLGDGRGDGLGDGPGWLRLGLGWWRGRSGPGTPRQGWACVVRPRWG